MPSDETPEEFGPQQAEKVVERFRRAWKKQQEPPLADFLPPPSSPWRRECLIELVECDQKLRYRTCCGWELERYLNLWPELASDSAAPIHLLANECLWRCAFWKPPEPTEMAMRFPSFAGDVPLASIVADADEWRQRNSFQNGGRFFPIRLLGKGGMGEVYAALDRERYAVVALKCLPSLDPTRLAMFQKEFRAASEFVHENVVQLYDFFGESETRFFTMELIDGVKFSTFARSSETSRMSVLDDDGDFDSHAPDADDLTATWAPWDQMDFDRVRRAFTQLAIGVSFLHSRKVLHRDLKPSNVMVKRDGTVVLLDFGLIARLQGEMRPEGGGEDSSDAHPGPGTPAYMSPEQAAGTRNLTEASDWYSVGVMLHEVLTERWPFQGSKSEIIARKQIEDAPPLPHGGRGIPPDLLTLRQDLLARDPASRPTGAEILARLHCTPVNGHELVPFVGRRDYLQSLERMFVRTVDGNATIVRVSGRSGVGKTRLVQHFLQQLEEARRAIILKGRCYERESIPYKALDGLIHALVEHLGALPDDDLDALIPQDFGALTRVFPVMQQLSSSRLPEWIPDVQELRRRAFQALRELLSGLSHRSPLVLYIDDLQWGDVDSAAVLAEILRPPDPPRLLLLVCYRNERETDNECLQVLRQKPPGVDDRDLEVDPLSAEDSEQLAQAALRDIERPERIEQIVREAQGSPYFITVLAQSGSTLGASGAVDLDEVLWQRVAQLDAEPRRLLETVCIAGGPLTQRNAHEASEVEFGNRLALFQLRADNFVRTAGQKLDDQIEVFHDRVRESVVGHLPNEVQRTRHLALAQTLERNHEPDPEALALHYSEGGDREKAGAYLLRAADRAGQELAFAHAGDLYRRALAMGAGATLPPGDLREKLARAVANAGRSDLAAVEFEKAAVDAHKPARMRRERDAAYHFLVSGHIDEGYEILKQVLANVGLGLPTTGFQSTCKLVLERTRLRLRRLKFNARPANAIPEHELASLDACWSASIGLAMVDVICASAFQSRCARHALDAGEPMRITRALSVESIFTAAEGTRTETLARTLLAAAEQVGSRLEAPYAAAMVKLGHSGVAMLTGNYRTACDRSVEAETIFRAHCTGVGWELDTALTYRLWSLIWRGEVNEIRRLGPALVEDAQQRGDLFALTNLRTYTIPHLLLWDGQPEEAVRTADEALQRWSRKGFFAQHLLGMVSRAEALLYKGDGAGARRFLAEQEAPYRKSRLNRIQYGYIQFLYSRARAALLAASQQRWDPKLLRSAEKDARLLSRENRRDALGMASVIRAGLAHARGIEDQTVKHLSDAIGLFEAMEMELHAAAASRALGRIHGGDDGRERSHNAELAFQARSVANPAQLAAALVPCCLK